MSVGSFVGRRVWYVAATLVSALIGFLLLLCTAESIWSNIGASLIAGAILSAFLLFELYAQQRDDATMHSIILAGIVAVHSRRNLETRYSDLLERFERIDVVGYSLRSWFEQVGTQVKKRAQSNDKVRVRIIAVNPASSASAGQERTEGAGELGGTFTASVSRLRKAFDGVARVEVRLLSGAPSTMIYRIDSTMFVGPYLVATPSAASPTWELRRNGWLFETFEEEFDAMWELAKPPAET